MSKKLTQEEFLKRAHEVHGNKYDYSKVEYVDSKTKVCIVCKEHGNFWQVPSSHLLGNGCAKCAQERRGKNSRLTTGEFIRKAKAIHGDKYDYSKTQYIGGQHKVCIVCPKHGEFYQLPTNHLGGKGCNECNRESKKSRIRNIGINDLDFPVKDNGKDMQFYTIWKAMLQRCYDNRLKEKLPTYQECYVCEEWKYLSNFKKWYDEHYVEGWHLDKDILMQGNKFYSPETCCFVPFEINVLFRRRTKTKTILERAQTLANKYKELLEPRVYYTLINYKVKTTEE